ncbi:hypothetical protein GCM10020331_057580 [Ectobacillus funiculus]
MVITNLQGKQLSAHTLYYNLALWITLGSIAGNAAFNTNLAFFPDGYLCDDNLFAGLCIFLLFRLRIEGLENGYLVIRL